MAYAVRLTRRAHTDADTAFEHIRELSPSNADNWLRGLFVAITSLADLPARCPFIPEAYEIGHSVRHLLYGKRSAVYRIIFDVQEESDQEPSVRVLRIWHGRHLTFLNRQPSSGDFPCFLAVDQPREDGKEVLPSEIPPGVGVGLR